MKKFVILTMEGRNAVIVNKDSHLYADYLMSGYEVVYTGNKRDCHEILDNESSLIID